MTMSQNRAEVLHCFAEVMKDNGIISCSDANCPTIIKKVYIIGLGYGSFRYTTYTGGFCFSFNSLTSIITSDYRIQTPLTYLQSSRNYPTSIRS